MDPVSVFLLAIAGIFVIGSVGELIFQRTNIPDVIWLIIAGILLGPVSGLLTREMLHGVAPYFAAITLVVVLFEGGSALKLGELRAAASRSSLLALSSFTGALIGIALLGASFGFLSERLHEWFGVSRFLPAAWTPLHGVLLGTILAGSSSIIIMPAMAAAKVDAKIANLVSLESAVTDALCVVGTAAVVDIMLGAAEGAAGPVLALLKSFGIGAGIGLLAGTIWILLLRVLKDAQHAYPLTLAALLMLYVVIDKAGGSAAFGILTVAIMLGNARLIGSRIGLRQDTDLGLAVKGFHGQMAFIVKSLFFVFIGAMLGPPWGSVLLGILVGVALFLLRLPSVKLAMLGSGLSSAELGMVNVAMPRGMAAGVLATLPLSKGVPGTEGLPVLVFTAVFCSILIFAAGFPLAKRRLEPSKQLGEGWAYAQMPAGAALPRELADAFTERLYHPAPPAPREIPLTATALGLSTPTADASPLLQLDPSALVGGAEAFTPAESSAQAPEAPEAPEAGASEPAPRKS